MLHHLEMLNHAEHVLRHNTKMYTTNEELSCEYSITGADDTAY